MNTEIVKISATDSSEKYEKAVELLKSDNVVGMPTETVYGLAGNAYSEKAVKRIFEAKGRPQDNPLIVHISQFSEIYDLVSEVPEIAKKLAEKFWPGPLTMILPKSEKVPFCVTAGLSSVAVRCPSHPVARNLIKYKACKIDVILAEAFDIRQSNSYKSAEENWYENNQTRIKKNPSFENRSTLSLTPEDRYKARIEQVKNSYKLGLISKQEYERKLKSIKEGK